jgi:serine/threonine protein kinase/uncharacterized caspase-like protein
MPPENSCRAGVALVIGVGEYLRTEAVESLRFAARDAQALADALADPDLCAFPRDQVVLLTDRDAPRDAVVQRLSRWLPERARGAELVVIYFAGHGLVQTVGRRQEGFLLPYDADPDDVVTRGVAMSDVASWIDGLDARAVVVCLDCCHAGKVLGQRGPAVAARNMELRPALLEGMSGRGRYLIASCDEGQKSYECAELGHGLFTFHLLEGIGGAADRDGDGRVGLAELFNYVATAVARDARQRFGGDQKPWTSATWAEETYISAPGARTPAPEVDPLEERWRRQGAAAAVREIEETVGRADEDTLRRAARFLGRVRDPAGVPALFRCLAHAAEAVRTEAHKAVHALGWGNVVAAVEALARGGDVTRLAAVLDGLNAFEAHPRVVGLLDRLVVLLKGELRNRAVLLLERKRLGLGLERVAALFREIHSPYEIRKVLGQGLFTETYLARDEGTGLEVVVRVLRPEFADQPHVRARFLDLSNQSVHLVHEKLALTREARAFPDRNVYFAVRDYVAGVTLQRVLEGGKRFEPAKVVRILRDVAEALMPLHRKAACHGAVKPSNIFLCDGGRRVLLGDPSLPVCGIGVALDRLAYDYRYAAPEMFLGGAAPGPRADFYALGCVAYELLCGQPPFVSDNFHELAARHINGAITPPSQRGSKFGAKGDAVVLKLLTRMPAERYGTLEEVLRALSALEDALQGPAGELPVGSAPTPPLLRDASLVNYQGAQSVLNFDRTGGHFAGGTSEGTVYPTTAPELPGESVAGGQSLGELKDRLAGDRYRILKELGKGAMGTVYLAQDTSLQRQVALKIPRFDSAEMRERFFREARNAATLDHPNICPVYDVGEYAGVPYLTMAYIEGQPLGEELRAGKPMPQRRAVEIVAKLARALEEAHRHGVVHRDIKPSNVMVNRRGEPVIMDFGLARRMGQDVSMTHQGYILGTPAYMSPEQVEGDMPLIGPASDQYALGVILYELLTGNMPYQAKSVPQVMLKILTDSPKPPSALRPDLEPTLEQICLRAMARKIPDRFASLGDFAEALERWLRGEPVHLEASVKGGPPGGSLETELPSIRGNPPASIGETRAAERPPGVWRRLLRFFFGKPARPRGDG